LLLGKFAVKRGIWQQRKLVTLELFSSVLIVADLFGVEFINDAKRCIFNQVIPVKHIANKLIEIPKIISSYIDIKKENDRLKLELDQLKIKTITASNAEKELIELKKIVNLKISPNTFKYLEKVLGYDKSVFESFVLISATHENTKEGAIVISSDGLVGIIHDVKNGLARVMPVTHPKFAIPVTTKTGANAILIGTGRNELTAAEFKDDALVNLKCGDIFYTSGEGGVFERDTAVAVIDHISRETNEVSTIPAVSLNELRYVWIVARR
jgi:rod shape-determining protein MreC